MYIYLRTSKLSASNRHESRRKCLRKKIKNSVSLYNIVLYTQPLLLFNYLYSLDDDDDGVRTTYTYNDIIFNVSTRKHRRRVPIYVVKGKTSNDARYIHNTRILFKTDNIDWLSRKTTARRVIIAGSR